MIVNVIPLSDSNKLHVCGEECWCFPLLKDGVRTHNALDCREAKERQGVRDPEKKWCLIIEPGTCS